MQNCCGFCSEFCADFLFFFLILADVFRNFGGILRNFSFVAECLRNVLRKFCGIRAARARPPAGRVRAARADGRRRLAAAGEPHHPRRAPRAPRARAEFYVPVVQCCADFLALFEMCVVFRTSPQISATKTYVSFSNEAQISANLRKTCTRNAEHI